MENYFNYFTEIERHYQAHRASFTLLSTLDWVLIEAWKSQGIPLDVVLTGIDRAFARAKRRVGSLAYCVNAVAEVVEEQKNLRTAAPEPPSFPPEKVRAYLGELARQVEVLSRTFPDFAPAVASVSADLEGQEVADLQAAESALTALEDKLMAVIQLAAPAEALRAVRREVEGALAPYRSKMTAEQLTMLDGQLWRRKLLERFGAPRLSLFYLM